MNKLCLFAIAIFCIHHVNAQDTIIKSNNEQVIVKILEITAKEVKYKKFNFLDGPTYIEYKTDIQLIKYSNGSSERFQPAPTPIQAPVVVQKKDSSSKTAEPITADDYYQPGNVQPVSITTQTPVVVQKKDSVSKTPEPNPADDYYQPGKTQPASRSTQTTTIQQKENITKAPEKVIRDDYYAGSQTPVGRRSGQLSVSKKEFKHNETIITEKEFYNLLKQTNDKEILRLVEKAGRAKRNQYISFGCILGGTSFILFPPAFLILEPVPFIFYFTKKATRKSCNKKAAELYNKRF